MWKKKKENGNPVAKELVEEAKANISEEEAKELLRCRKLPKALVSEESN